MAINGIDDISFTNSLGTVSFAQCLLSLEDQWTWDGRGAVLKKIIALDGWVQRGASVAQTQGLEAVLSSNGYGDEGTLTLPWATLSHIKLISVSYPESAWNDWSEIHVQFEDDHPNDNVYTLSFNGLTLHNPTLQITLPTREVKDEYIQMPWFTGSYDSSHLDTKPMRAISGYGNIGIALAGTIMLDDYELPAGIESTLMPRLTVYNAEYALPAGYPRPFRLQEMIAEVGADINYACVIVVSTDCKWDLEESTLYVEIKMTAPPQQLGA